MDLANCVLQTSLIGLQTRNDRFEPPTQSREKREPPDLNTPAHPRTAEPCVDCLLCLCRPAFYTERLLRTQSGSFQRDDHRSSGAPGCGIPDRLAYTRFARAEVFLVRRVPHDAG